MTSHHVIHELTRALQSREFRISHEEIPFILQFVHSAVLACENVGQEDLESRYARLDDKKDLHVLAAFEKFKCDMLVTGDKKLLKKVKGTGTTKQALEMILGES